MATYPRPLTAFERARAAYDQMMRQQRAAMMLRRSRLRVRRIKMTIGVVAAITLAVSAVIYSGLLSTRFGSLSFGRNEAPEHSMGEVRTLVGNDTCQKLRFNNERGVFVGGTIAPCDDVRKQRAPALAKGTRLDSIRNAFKR